MDDLFEAHASLEKLENYNYFLTIKENCKENKLCLENLPNLLLQNNLICKDIKGNPVSFVSQYYFKSINRVYFPESQRNANC